MLNYEDYFNDLTKINAQLNFYINKPKVLKKYTNILSDDYLNKYSNLNKKYSNTKDLELNPLVKQHIQRLMFFHLMIKLKLKRRLQVFRRKIFPFKLKMMY
jgi:hypothetical protein